LTTVLPPGLDRVKVDPGQIEQVIMNLVVNARDAMPHGGRITIETANVDLDESYGQSHDQVKPGRYVLLAVSDTGQGMTEEVKAHLFEPFFTTKEVGKGTGLGLATVFGIVKQSGGHVKTYSEIGYGTTFKIYLPSVAEVIPRVKTQAKPAPAATGRETILLVEDEKAVRTMTRLALQASGYTLLEAADGEEAIRVCEQHRGPIHLLVSDVVMPQMGGRQLAERLTALHTKMRVLFASGYTDDAVVRHGVLQAEVAFLQKPFSMDALQRKVRAVLDEVG
jgi:two-component system, cell cycle sensor histidine kinase and response regulator CckA